MKDFLEWLDKTSLAAKTKADYRNGARLVLASNLLGLRLDRITEDDINTTRFHESPYSANSALRTLRRMLRRAKRKGDILRDPPKIQCLEAPRRDITVATPDENRIFETIKQAESTRRYFRRAPAPLYEVFMLMLDSGMRDGEVVAMRWEYVQWQGAYYLNPNGKTRRARRRVPLSERVIEMLSSRRQEQGYPNSGWIFPSRKARSGHYELRALQRKFREIRRLLGLPDQLKLYCARHTFGTVAMDQLKNPYVVKEVMGHESLDTTMGYMHSETQQLKAVIDRHNQSKMVN
jgi:integrase